MHRIFRVKAYEMEYGPHFNEEHARKAVSKMENEDGSRGPHWSIEETTALANQHGVNLGNRFNRYDWYVALNMIYSDYYKVIVGITNSNNTKHFVEFAKAWMNDKDIEEGKMWYYYIYVMCKEIREAEMECFEEEEMMKREEFEGEEFEDEEDGFFGRFRRGGGRRRSGSSRGGSSRGGSSRGGSSRGGSSRGSSRGRRSEFDMDEFERMREEMEYGREYEPYEDYNRRATRYVRY